MTDTFRGILRTAAYLMAGALVSAPAQAHVGHAGEPAAMSSLIDGALHPLTGIDHLIILLGVGAYAAIHIGRSAWFLPAMFAGSMLAGFALGQSSAPFGLLELAIAGSTVGMLVLLLAPRGFQQYAVIPISLFGVAHGFAHGLAAPSAGAQQFALGMFAAALAASSFGMLAVRFLASVNRQRR